MGIARPCSAAYNLSVLALSLFKDKGWPSLKDWPEPEEGEELNVCHSRVLDHTADLSEHDYR